jgi:DNA-binding transcriptional MerR regulator
MQNKFTIGQMSKLHNISVKTLRYYDEIGLFTPFEVDDQTGYRYYTFEQFKKLDIICYLKMMGVPLKEIKKKVDHCSLDEFVQILADYQKITEEKISELQKIHERLKIRARELEGARTITQIGKPIIKTVPNRRIIEVKERVGTTEEIENVLRDLKLKINHLTPIIIGKVGFWLSVDHMKNRQFTDYDGIFLLVEEGIQLTHELFTVIPGGKYAIIYMRENRDKEAIYYDRLLTYIHQQGYQTVGPFFVRQIVDSFISHNEKDWLREIQIQIKPLTVQ